MKTFDDVLRLQAEADTLRGDGELEPALAAITAAVSLAAELEPDSADLGNLLCERAEHLEDLGRMRETLADAERGLAVLEPLIPRIEEDGPSLHVRALGLVGRLLCAVGEHARSRSRLEEALRVATAAFGADAEVVASVHNELGMLGKYSGAYTDAKRHYDRALAIIERVHGAGSLATAGIFHNLGGLAHAQERFAEGEPLARRAYEIRRAHLAEDHPATLADRAAWAGLLDGLERFAESEAIYRDVLVAYRERFGDEHYEVAATLHNLGAVERATGRLGDAIASLREALRLKELSVGDDSPDWALTGQMLALALHEAGQGAEARAVAERARAICAAKLAKTHPMQKAMGELLRAIDAR